MKNKNILMMMATLILLSACTSIPKTNLMTPSPNTAEVVFYREWRFFAGSVEPTVYVDGVMQFEMDNGTHQSLYLPPGKHQIKYGSEGFFDDWSGDIVFDLEIEPNQTYYLKFEIIGTDSMVIGNAVTFNYKGFVSKVDAKIALAEIKEIDD